MNRIYSTDNDQVAPYSTVIKDDKMYTFGNSQYVRVDDLNAKTYVHINFNTGMQISFNSGLYSFVYNDTIMVGGMSLSATASGYDIFSYDPDKNTFNHNVTLTTDDIFSNIKGINGGILVGFMDKNTNNYKFDMIYLMVNSKFYCYNFTNNITSSVTITMPTDTSIFSYPTTSRGGTNLPLILPKFSKGNTTFNKNGFIFIVTGSGEIFRVNFTADNKGSVTEVYINPCYGIPSYKWPYDIIQR
jgi:hypothetical protein